LYSILVYNERNYVTIEIDEVVIRFIGLVSFILFSILAYIEYSDKRYPTFIFSLIISIFFNPIFEIQYNPRISRFENFDTSFLKNIYLLLFILLCIYLLFELFRSIYRRNQSKYE
jgi:hypothetical protein